ncbi:TolC family protein [Vibrio penaeicida]|uniref:TolC family protein n=1 Tax=Vibrio penaeicida TaxID=104609 RepID=UPI000CEA6E98|nr:TolC family protein [Vibrio penaeicida]
MANKRLWVLSCIVVFGPVHALSIEEAWQAAKANNPEFEKATLAIAKKENALALSRSDRLPSLNVSADASWREGSSTSYSLNTALNWTIWDSSLWAKLDRDEVEVIISQLELVKIQNKLAKQLVEAYLNVASAQGDLQLVESKLKETRKQLIIIQQRYKAGRVKSIDVEQMFASEISDKNNILINQSKLAQMRLELDALILRQVDEVDQIRNDSLNEPERLVQFESDWIELAKDSSPALLIAAQIVQARKHDKEAAIGGYYPKLTGNFGASQSTSDLSDNDVNAGLSLSIPIDLNGTIQNKVDATSLSVRDAELDMRKLEIDIRKKVQLAHSQVEIKWQQVLASKTLIGSREKVLKMQQTLYDAGMSDTSKLIDAHNELYDARHKLKNNLYQYWRQRVALLAIAGQLDDDTMMLISQALES